MRTLHHIFLLQTLIIVTNAQTSRIIRDYFVYKNVSRVVGFSCGDVDEDFLTLKLLNAAGISTAIKPAGLKINIPRYLDTDRTLGVFVDTRCSNQDVSSIFDESSAYLMFDYSYVWLIFANNLNHSLQNVNDSNFSIVTDFAILVPDETDYILYDVYNHCKMRGSILNVTWLGTWRENDGLTINLTESKIIRRRNYHGLRIKAAGTVIHRPKNISLINYLKRDDFDLIDSWPKFGLSLFLHVSDMFNFTMDLIELNHWGKNDTNGPLMSLLKRDGADLGYYPSLLTLARYDEARLILQMWPTRTCFIFRTLPTTKLKPWIMLKPFATNTWYMIIVIVIITIIILSCTLKLEHAEEYNYSISTLITIAALCQQGFPSLTNQSASRIAFIQITIFGLLVYNYYSAAIVSARLNEPLQKMNDSLLSLVRSKMQLAAERIIFFDYLLENKNPEIHYFRHYWDNIPEWKRFLSVEDGLKGIKRGGFAYHADPSDIYPFIERAFDKQMICQLTEVHLLRPSQLGLWSNLKSHFHEISKIGLLRTSTAGLRQREIHRRSARKPYCPTDEIFISSVTIYEAAPILIFLLFGMILSIVVLIMEFFIFYIVSSKRSSNIKPGMKLSTKFNIKSNIDPIIKSNMKHSILSNVKSNIKIDRNKVSLQNTAPPPNNVTLMLPEASKLFQRVAMSKRYQEY